MKKTTTTSATSPLADPRIPFDVLTIFAHQWYCDDDGATRFGLIRATADEYDVHTGDELTPSWLHDHAAQIIRRVDKSKVEQRARTKRRAEVFTPVSLVARMVSYIYAPEPSEWRERVMARDLEVACGEAPFITTRYDPTTGEDVAEPARVGILDRKFRAIYEHTKELDASERQELLYGALTHTCGTELAADNVLIARANIFLTWREAFVRVMDREPTDSECAVAGGIIVATIVQVDMMTGLVPTTDWAAMVGVYGSDADAPVEFRSAFYNPPVALPKKRRSTARNRARRAVAKK